MTRRTREEWQALFAAQARSGLSAAAFCREHGLKASQFWRRRRQLQGPSRSGAARSAFVPVTVRRSVEPPVMELRVGPALSLRLPGSVAPTWVAELLSALRD